MTSPVAPAVAAVLAPALTALTAAEMQGTVPYGGAFAGQFQDGQTLEQAFNIQTGKCYAVVAVGRGLQDLAPLVHPADL